MDNNSPNDNSILNLLKTIWSDYIIGIPTVEYKTLFKTGKIQQMSNDEKTELLLKNYQRTTYLNTIMVILKTRPNIMDDDDFSKYMNIKQKFDYFLKIFVVGLFINFSFLSFQYLVRKKKPFKFFFISNFILFGMFAYAQNNFTTDFVQICKKYEALIPENKLIELIKECKNIH